MQIVDTDVLTPSFMDFSLPSEFAKSALYYCPQFGQFICNSDYQIERNGIDQYLLIYINSGSLCIRTDGMTAEAHEGEIALFDCRKPHCYWCPDKVDFYWFHFNGASSKQYTEYLTERFGLVHEKQPMIFRQRRSGLFRSDFTISDVICVLKNTEWVLTLSWGSKRMKQVLSSWNSSFLYSIARRKSESGSRVTVACLSPPFRSSQITYCYTGGFISAGATYPSRATR